MISSADTRKIHDAYCKYAKRDLKFTTTHGFAWERWLFEGYTAENLEMVCKYLWKLVRSRQRKIETFNFRSLIEDLPRFADDLCSARSEARTPQVDPARQSVLRSANRPEKATTGTARSAKDILAGDEAFRKFREETKDL